LSKPKKWPQKTARRAVFYCVASEHGYINTHLFGFKTNNIRKKIDNVMLYLDEIRNNGFDFAVV
jgi:hypothetical protein